MAWGRGEKWGMCFVSKLRVETGDERAVLFKEKL